MDHEGQPWDPTGVPRRRLRGSATPRRGGSPASASVSASSRTSSAPGRLPTGVRLGSGASRCPRGRRRRWAAAAAGAAADLGKPRKPEDIVAAVLLPTAGTLDALIGATLVSLSLSAISPEGGFPIAVTP